jgi:hypothetical protein
MRQDNTSIEYQARQTYAYIYSFVFFLLGGGGRLAKCDKTTPLFSTRLDRHICIYSSAVCFFLGGGDVWKNATRRPLY